MAKKTNTSKKIKKPTKKSSTKKTMKLIMPAGKEMSQPGARGGFTSGSGFPGYRGK